MHTDLTHPTIAQFMRNVTLQDGVLSGGSRVGKEKQLTTEQRACQDRYLAELRQSINETPQLKDTHTLVYYIKFTKLLRDVDQVRVLVPAIAIELVTKDGINISVFDKTLHKVRNLI